MFIIAKESRTKELIESYKKVCVYTTTKAKSYTTEGGEKISFARAELVSEDTVNAVINGHMKANKVIKKAVAQLHNPKADDMATNIALVQLVTMVSGGKGKVAPVVILMIPDETDLRTSFIVKYVKAMVEEFGITPVTSSTKINLKGKKKKKKLLDFIFSGKKKKIRSKLVEYGQHKVSSKGRNLRLSLANFYDIEILMVSASNFKHDQYGKGLTGRMTKALLGAYTNENLHTVNGEKMMKSLAKKNKTSAKAYKSFCEIIDDCGVDVKLPKVKYGQAKKGKKAKGAKFNTKKFVKFFGKQSNVAILSLLYAHTFACSSGLVIGSTDYVKVLNHVTSQFDPALSKKILDAAKAYGKTVAA